MRSLSKINNFALLALFFMIHMISIPCGAEPHCKICSNNTETYTRNSPYGNNLRNLLDSLSVNTSLKEGFYDTSFGTDDDQVYGQALCRGDVAADVCKSCVSNASKEIMKQCPGDREAFLWYEKCQIQYSYSMSLNEPYTGKYPDSNDYEKNVSNSDSFHKDLKDLMNYLSNKAAYGRSKFMFATGKSNSVSKIETIYGLVQCTRDISQKSCESCLDKAWGDLDGCCGHRQGGTLFSRSCNMRFELYKFYEESSANESGKRWKMWVILAVACGATIAIAGLVGCYVFHRCQRNEVQTDDDNSQRVFLHTMGASTRVTITEENNIFSSQDLPFMELAILKAATENFSDRHKLGQGGFGTVYKGVLPNGMEIAVKRLSRKSWQGIEEFKNEIILIAKLQHRNLVRLLSCGIEGDEQLLIYEYMPNKSLDRFIYDPEKRSQLGWDKRLNIINGIARGVLYLHEDSRLKIIHRDLKPSNVLLDHDMVAKISDFGMARIFGEDESTSNTKRVVGTYGYMAPEYAMGGQFSVKSDVFSFGVILLEIISGKKNSGFYLTEHAQTLVAYAWRLWNEGKELEFVDALLMETCPVAEVVRCIHIGLLCVQEDPEERPTMSSIVVLLGSESIALPQPGQPAFSVGRGAHKIDKSSSTDPSVNQVTFSDISPR